MKQQVQEEKKKQDKKANVVKKPSEAFGKAASKKPKEEVEFYKDRLEIVQSELQVREQEYEQLALKF